MKLSLCRHHFPDIHWIGAERKLWNPVSKKAFADRPEERVRLQCAEALIQSSSFPPSRLSFETGLSGSVKKNTLRTDLVAYSTEMKAFLLVECKKPEIRLDENTVRQALIYNDVLKTQHIWLTNGFQDVFISGGKVTDQPEWLNTAPPFERDALYWMKKGFVTEKSAPLVTEWINAWFSPANTGPFTVVSAGTGKAHPHFARAHVCGKMAALSTFWVDEDQSVIWNVFFVQNNQVIAVLDTQVPESGLLSSTEFSIGSEDRVIEFEKLIGVPEVSPLSFGYQEFIETITTKLFPL